jgi:Mn-dependent DtxR family transcriptional regulator
MTARTKEERYIIRLYELAQAAGDIDHRVNKYQLGQSINMSPKLVNAICKVLMRTNFIKFADNDQIYITRNGKNLAKTLLEE